MSEDIKILKELIEEGSKDLLNCWDYGEEAKQAISNVLNELERLQKEKITNEFTAVDLDKILADKYIPKQTIRDNIEEYLDYDRKYKTYTEDGRENFTMQYFKAKALQALLGDENG